jgi:lipopolysaccharide/colanic/teichoic acid biosynthesis glycosyltransferase
VTNNLTAGGSAIAAGPESAVVAEFQSRKKLDGVGIVAGRAVACLLAPFVALVAAFFVPFILMSSNEFPIWRQKRVGYRGRDILVPKFSTMNADATGTLQETWFGRLVRPVGLDEILQILIIATGDMQWFGPRPFLRHHVNDEYIQAVLFLTKPGFINSRSIATGIGNRALQGGIVSISELIRYDRDDLSKWSFGYAVSLMARTVLAVLKIN